MSGGRCAPPDDDDDDDLERVASAIIVLSDSSYSVVELRTHTRMRICGAISLTALAPEIMDAVQSALRELPPSCVSPLQHHDRGRSRRRSSDDTVVADALAAADKSSALASGGAHDAARGADYDLTALDDDDDDDDDDNADDDDHISDKHRKDDLRPTAVRASRRGRAGCRRRVSSFLDIKLMWIGEMK